MQDQMDKYDGLSEKVKHWVVTLWAASIGWSFQVKRKEILLVSVVIVLVFWILDAYHKMFRTDYKQRRDEISMALQELFTKSTLPAHVVSPQFPLHPRMGVLHSFYRPHLAFLYIAFILIVLILYWNF